MRKLLSTLFIILFLALPNILRAEEVPSGGEMMSDVLFVRPLSMVALGLGTGLFLVSLPFAAIPAERGEILRETSNKLVIYPFHFAFLRRVGKFPGYMDEIDYVQD